ncbi:MAG: nucleotidyltransferase domain-containing protein [Desulfobacterales bacterium]|nr:nucleotidyltransferase domain-containing protein [Desulfobacterales bacterium]
MSTTIEHSKLSKTLFGKTRRAVLSVLYSHTDESFYLRQLVRITGVGVGAMQRELKQLTDSGIIRRLRIGRQIFFQANTDCPVFKELRDLVIKTIGVGDVLRSALVPLAERIQIAFIYGSLARGEETRSSDLDVLVVGDLTFAEVVSAISPLQETLSREINPSVYPLKEFKSKVSEGQHFISTVLEAPKIFVIGDNNELEKLVG